MPQRVEERLRPITPQLAWRVAVLGGIAFVLFGIVFFRLWYLQVLTGQEARVSARQNRVRKVQIEAPRGDIVDRNRVPLVQTKRAAVVQLVPVDAAQVGARRRRDRTARRCRRPRSRASAPRRPTTRFRRQLRDDGRKTTKAEKRAARARSRPQGETARTGGDPGDPERSEARPTSTGASRRSSSVSPKTIHSRVIRGIADAPYSNVTIRTDVPPAAVRLHARAPGVLHGHRRRPAQPAPATRRTSSPPSCSGPSRRSPRSSARAAPSTTRASPPARAIGQSGLEWQYDDILRGKDGSTRVVVNALGTPRRAAQGLGRPSRRRAGACS